MRGSRCDVVSRHDFVLFWMLNHRRVIGLVRLLCFLSMGLVYTPPLSQKRFIDATVK